MPTLIDDRTKYEAKMIDIRSVLNKHGVKYSGRVGTSEYKYYCPFHNDTNTPNLSVSISKNVFNCFACGINGDVIDLVGYFKFGKSYNKYNKDHFTEVIRELTNNPLPKKPIVVEEEKELEITLEDIREYEKNLSKESINYLWERGIRNPSLYKIGERYIKDIPYISFPLIYKGELKAVKYRRNDNLSKEGNAHHTEHGSECSYPYILYKDSDKRIFIFEDIISSISAKELGFPSASLCGGNRIPKKNGGRERYKKNWSSRELIVIPDSDEAGMGLVKDLQKLELNIVKIISLPEPYKDFNDYVQEKPIDAFFELARFFI